MSDLNDPSVAASAVSDPATSTFDLLHICMAHPALRAQVAMHPSADMNLLSWIAGQEEPVAAAIASSRLAQAPVPPPVPQFQPTSLAPQGLVPDPASSRTPVARRRGTRIALWSGVGVLAVALVTVAAVTLVPRLGAAGTYDYAPDLQELPGLVSVDVRSGLPKGDYEWSTSVRSVPDAGFVIASNSNTAYDQYQSQLAAYRDAVASLQQWRTDYQSGHVAGQSCLNGAGEPSYYDSRAEYCLDNSYAFLSTSMDAAMAGFYDAIDGNPSTPDRPGDSRYIPPQVPAKPSEPKVGTNLVGVDLATGKVAWQLELKSIWQDAYPRLVSTFDSGDQALILMDDAETAGTDSSRRFLALLNVKAGTVSASTELEAEQTAVIGLFQDVAILTDEDGSLRGLSTTDLTTEKWRSSARPYWWESEESGLYWNSTIPGSYLLTDEGYISAIDGTRADFARDAGQDSVQLSLLAGTTDTLIRLQAAEPDYDVSGFDPRTDQQTWRLSGVSPWLRMADGLLLVPSEGEITAYRINGDDLDRRWRYSCEGSCTLNFADDARAIVSEWDSTEVVVLNTADGEELDSTKNSGGGSPILGSSVMYLEQNQRLVARDLSKAGLPTLWRSIPFDGQLIRVGDRFVIEGTNAAAGLVGILGLDGDDWNEFRVKEG